jgi:glycosyltransferase involved in cell wall biosynthesis
VPLLGFLPEEIAQARENLRSFAKRNFYELLFVGGAHPPNIDALNWFVQEILPLILSTSPQTRLHIVGAAAFSEIAHFDSGALILHGNLSDDELAALYAEIGIVVIPLRFGGGVKGKMIEALFHAAPIVTTPIGMQGLDPNSPLAFVAASCDAFAEAILEIQKSPSEAKRQVESGLAFIENDYSIAALRRGFAAVIPECESKSGLE